VPTLRNAHVLITGGSSGIGLATALLAVERGARVSLIARRPDVLDEAAASLRSAGGEVAVAATDVADAGQVTSAVSSLT
jgi:NADP-dependent 3-hydroxy acid dehydrogenase YdfG